MIGRGEPAASRVLVIAGPPGAGKSTLAQSIARRLEEPAACIESDWFWTTVVSGFVPPWEPAADRQNRTVLRAVASAAAELARGGYTTVVDGVIGPWNLPSLQDVLAGADVHLDYVVLRPDLAACLARAAGRADEAPRIAGNPPLTDTGPIRDLWGQFADLGRYEPHVVDTTDLGPPASVDLVLAGVAAQRFAVPAASRG